jgi:hypothetical protein
LPTASNPLNKNIIISAAIFTSLIVFGSILAKKNTLAVAINDSQIDSTITPNKEKADSIRFVMPAFDEQAIKLQQQQQILSQMTPAQKAEYQRQYNEYMQQLEMQEEYLRQKEEYERQMKNGEYVPPVSKKTQSKIEELKEKFRQKQIQDSLELLMKRPAMQ